MISAPTFSIKNRDAVIAKATEIEYDLIVIGGGITGCGIALDAVSRGLKTLLVEKEDFAAGTSSRSTKLIHGGLRYLKQFEIGLVRETGLERAIVHHIAPHLVHAEKMMLPIVEDGTFNKWTASLAISVYDMLAKVKKEDRKVMYPKEKTLELEPLLSRDILKSSIVYSEYRTDDARLTIEIVKKAVSLGADAFNYMEVQDFLYHENRKIKGVRCFDHIYSQEHIFKARVVVSAAGPWVDQIREIDNSKKGKSLRLTKGVHIVCDRKILPIHNAVYFDAFDGRMIFAIPRGKSTYIGTTDTDYQGGSLEKVLCNEVDATYIIDAVNRMFPSIKLTLADIKSTWAGLRPLIHEDGKSPSELSRKDEIFVSDSGLLSIAGGKLTGYRKMAQRIVSKVCETLGYKAPKSKTKRIKLTPNPFDDSKDVLMYIDKLSKLVAYSKAWYLITTYGKEAMGIVNRAQSNRGDLNDNILLEEIKYGIDHEYVTNPIDYFVRRSGKTYFDIDEVHKTKEQVLQIMDKAFSWGEDLRSLWSFKIEEMIKDVAVHK
jgi:glycerol-3-phosphate dehydrogenase